MSRFDLQIVSIYTAILLFQKKIAKQSLLMQGQKAPQGFQNFGNTCYLNAALQAFRPLFESARKDCQTKGNMANILELVYRENNTSPLLNYFKNKDDEFNSLFGLPGNSMVFNTFVSTSIAY